MRLALLSDTHGNPIAVDAVLEDIEAQGGVDGYWVLGDVVALGHDPIGVLERLTALPNVRFLQGNTDRYVVTGERPYPQLDDVAADPVLLPRLVEVAQTFAWTQALPRSRRWSAAAIPGASTSSGTSEGRQCLSGNKVPAGPTTERRAMPKRPGRPRSHA